MPKALKSNPMPLYLQMARELRSRIMNGNLEPNDRLPSLELLADEFGIARVTARQAISLLEKEGLIWRKQGKGTFVTPGLKKRHWLKLSTEWAEIIEMAVGTSIKMLDLSDATHIPKLSPNYGKPAKNYKLMKRVHSREETPYGIIDIYLDKRVYEQAPQMFLENFVLSSLEKIPNLEIRSVHQTLTLGTADLKSAEHLGIEIGSPVANVRRVILDQFDSIVYVGDVIYCGEYVRLEMNINI